MKDRRHKAGDVEMAETKELNFEESLEKLEEIVERLEGGDLDLDGSLKLYEEGVRLSQACAKRLEHAQKRIEVLTRGESGELRAEEAGEDLKPKKKKR